MTKSLRGLWIDIEAAFNRAKELAQTGGKPEDFTDANNKLVYAVTRYEWQMKEIRDSELKRINDLRDPSDPKKV